MSNSNVNNGSPSGKLPSSSEETRPNLIFGPSARYDDERKKKKYRDPFPTLLKGPAMLMNVQPGLNGGQQPVPGASGNGNNVAGFNTNNQLQGGPAVIGAFGIMSTAGKQLPNSSNNGNGNGNGASYGNGANNSNGSSTEQEQRNIKSSNAYANKTEYEQLFNATSTPPDEEVEF